MVVQYRGVTGEKTGSSCDPPPLPKKTLQMELINGLNSRTEWHRLIKCLEVGFVCIHLLLPHTAETEKELAFVSFVSVLPQQVPTKPLSG